MDGSPLVTASPKPYKHACERCRNSKLKCKLDSLDATGKCTRCLGANAECIFEPLAPRRRRKRTDARVTTLERELRSMKSMLDNLRDSQAAESKAASLSSQTPSTPAINSKSPAESDGAWFIPDLISDRLAAELFQEFVDHLLPQYPIVLITESFQSLRLSKPILLLATVAAAGSTRAASLFRMLHSHLVRQVTEKVIIEGERSVELVQSILILETWYYPPDDLRRLNFYQWIHIAGTMALQLGMGGRTGQQQLDISQYPFDKRRTMFAVFQACSAVAEILDTFDSSTTSLSDKQLVAWVRLQVIAEEVERIKPQVSLSEFVRLLSKFDQWEHSTPNAAISASLNVHYHYNKAKLFEVMLHVEQESEELIPPFLPTHDPVKVSDSFIEPFYMDAVIGLISSCHAVLETVISMDENLLRGCPTVTFVKTLYAIKVLSMLQKARDQPEHAIRYVVDQDRLNLNGYIHSLCGKLKAAAQPMKSRVPSMILHVAEKIAAHITETRTNQSEIRDASLVQGDNSTLCDHTFEITGPLSGQNGAGETTTDPVSTTLPTQSFNANGFLHHMPSDTAALSDFEDMIMPDFFLQFDNYSNSLGWGMQV